MFIDWLDIYQDFEEKMPVVSEHLFIVIDTKTGEKLTEKQPAFSEKGSYSSAIRIRVSGQRIYVQGNPSRFNRLDNLFGYTDIDSCVRVYNNVLLKHGLPPFTKTTEILKKIDEKSGKNIAVPNGAVITQIHVTSNYMVGSGNTDEYLRGVSTQRVGYSLPRLHTNGKAVDWLSSRGKASSVYRTVYEKSNEMLLHLLPKIKKAYGDGSAEYAYVVKLCEYCRDVGLVRYEQKIKSSYLRKHGLNYYGMVSLQDFEQLQNDFVGLNDKLSVNTMKIESVADRLISAGLSVRSANTTMSYALRWMHGEKFDLSKSQVKIHRGRLRGLGLDIADPFNASKHSIVYVRNVKQVELRDAKVPDWYVNPGFEWLHAA